MNQYSLLCKIGEGLCDSLSFFSAKNDMAAIKYAKARAKKIGWECKMVRKAADPGKRWAPIFWAC